MGFFSWLNDNTIEAGKKWMISKAIKKQIVRGILLGVSALGVWLAKHNIDVDVSKIIDPEIAAEVITGLVFLVMDTVRSRVTFKPETKNKTEPIPITESKP